MEMENQPHILPLVKKKSRLGDDRYLAEMTERLRKLRALMGDSEVRKGRPKRWLGRDESDAEE